MDWISDMMVEIIEFKYPDTSRTLYIHNIATEYACEDDLRVSFVG